MASVHSLLSVCQTTPRDVAEPAQARIALWDKWLAPVTPDNPAGDDAGYDDDFQQMREEVNNLSGADAGIVSQLAEAPDRRVGRMQSPERGQHHFNSRKL